MSALVQVTTDVDVAIITVNNPLQNTTGDDVVKALQDAFALVEHDRSVRGIVLIGGSTFIVLPGMQRLSVLSELLQSIEDCSKPVVATIRGSALGGGFEIATACHYRLAAPATQLGLPAVKLGLIPGAGGMQRLVRLSGIAKALEMCTEGNPVAAEEAVKSGIIDRLIEGDLLTGAVAFAREILGKPAIKTRERADKLGTTVENAPVFAAAREQARKKRGTIAALAAIDAIEAAANLPFDEACEIGMKLFDQCLLSDQSKALIHAYFAEHDVAFIPDLPKETPTTPIHSVGILGAGTMGGGIAMVFANAGIPVLIKETDQSALDRGLAAIRKNYDTSVKRGRFTQKFVDERLKLIQSTLTYEGFEGVDMVVEAVFEGMAIKKSVFRELDGVCKPGAILASNTSYMDIDEIASATSRPEAVLGTHFFSPANVMKLLEVVRGKRTGKQVIATCMQLSKKLGKVGVLVGNCRGFVGNRMFAVYRREAQFLVEEGASVEAVDKALYNFGMAMGPLSVADLAGLDISWRMRKEFRHLQEPDIRQPILEDRLCEINRFGQKTGAGWYKYDENRRAVSDPEVVELIRKWTAEAGIPQRHISAEEIVDRCIYMLVNEGARILEEGIALRAGDIDTIYLNGYGFPNYRGGPMWYADTVGLKQVYDRTLEFQHQHGKLWQPAPLLEELAKEGKTFADFTREQAATVQTKG